MVGKTDNGRQSSAARSPPRREYAVRSTSIVCIFCKRIPITRHTGRLFLVGRVKGIERLRRQSREKGSGGAFFSRPVIGKSRLRADSTPTTTRRFFSGAVKGIERGCAPVPAGNFDHPVNGQKGEQRAALRVKRVVRPGPKATAIGRKKGNNVAFSLGCASAFRLGVPLKKQHRCFFLTHHAP